MRRLASQYDFARTAPMTIKTNSFIVAGPIGAAKNRPSQGHDADRLTWSVSAAARRIGVGKTTLYKLSRERKLRLVKVAGRTLVPDSEIKRLLMMGDPIALQPNVSNDGAEASVDEISA